MDFRTAFWLAAATSIAASALVYGFVFWMGAQ